MRSYWRQVSKHLWSWLLTNDYDFFDAAGNVVPPDAPSMVRAASGSDVKCGRFSRNFIRMAFHDCGTYSRFLKDFGCNGSLRKELPRPEPWLDYTTINPDGKSFKLVSTDVFDQFKVNGVMPSAVDVEYNAMHQENAGLAAAIAAIYQAKLYANSASVGLWDASFSDVLALASLLGMARCDGPHVKFVPGRPDSRTADQDDQLPNFNDNFFHTLFYFIGAGMSELDGVVLIGGSHTAACFKAGCMDSTPTKVDKAWAEEVLAWDGQSPAVCGTAATSRCRAPSDKLWLEHPQTKDYLKLMTSPVTTFPELNHQVNRLLSKQGVQNYKGLNQAANLCETTDRNCPGFTENYAMHTLMATSMFRLLTLVPANA